MNKASRIRNIREDWPFMPWSGNKIVRWEVDGRRTTRVISRGRVLGWRFLVVVPILLVGLAGVALAHRHAGSQTSARDQPSRWACADQHMAELVREHLLVVRGL